MHAPTIFFLDFLLTARRQPATAIFPNNDTLCLDIMFIFILFCSFIIHISNYLFYFYLDVALADRGKETCQWTTNGLGA